MPLCLLLSHCWAQSEFELPLGMRKLKQAGIVAAVTSNSARLDQLAVRGAVLCCKALRRLWVTGLRALEGQTSMAAAQIL